VLYHQGKVTVMVRETVTETITDNVMDDASDDAGPQWVTLGEFARRLRITRAGVYGRIKRGTVESRRRGNKGFEVRWPPPDHPGIMGDGHGNRSADDHDHSGDVARDGAHYVTGEVAAMQVEIARLEERLAGAERAHKAEVLAREVVIADLRMALAEARRPWWRRWLS
jgi:hypothetical protein